MPQAGAILPPYIFDTIKFHSMPFQKGVSGNPAGRALGSTSEKNAIVRDAILSILTEGTEKLKAEMNKLEAKDYVAAYTAMLEYVVAKKARIQVTDDGEGATQQVFVIDDQIITFN